jgi:hypothetical protein
MVSVVNNSQQERMILFWDYFFCVSHVAVKTAFSLLQVYHNYKVVATNFLEETRQINCIKIVQYVYHKRTSS